MEQGWRDYGNCKIMDVRFETPEKQNSYVVDVQYYDKNKNPYHYDIKFNKIELYSELMKLVQDESSRFFATYDMADIDIFKEINAKTGEVKYAIEVSPCDNSYHTFHFNEENFINQFVNVVKELEEPSECNEEELEEPFEKGL